MDNYIFVEYPKCLYNDNGDTLTVENTEEEENAKVLGWKTAKEYHNYQDTAAPTATTDNAEMTEVGPPVLESEDNS